jgi:5-(carboxyamino)imidazole ribonucleotide synthase
VRTVAAYEDAAALARFAASVAVVTFEFENVPSATLDALARLVPCRPGVHLLQVGQDRLREKAFFEQAGIPVAPWRAVTSREELEAAILAVGLPAVLKTTRLGYDGRGQAVLRSPADADAAWARLEPRPLILEAFVPFEKEVSAIAARGLDGTLHVFDATENRHANHILDLSLAPAPVPERSCAGRRHWWRGLPWRWTSSASWHSNCSCCRTAPCSGTRWHRGHTIRATGRWMPAPSASSRCMCAPLPGFPFPRQADSPTRSCGTS